MDRNSGKSKSLFGSPAKDKKSPRTSEAVEDRPGWTKGFMEELMDKFKEAWADAQVGSAKRNAGSGE